MGRTTPTMTTNRIAAAAIGAALALTPGYVFDTPNTAHAATTTTRPPAVKLIPRTYPPVHVTGAAPITHGSANPKADPWHRSTWPTKPRHTTGIMPRPFIPNPPSYTPKHAGLPRHSKVHPIGKPTPTPRQVKKATNPSPKGYVGKHRVGSPIIFPPATGCGRSCGKMPLSVKK